MGGRGMLARTTDPASSVAASAAIGPWRSRTRPARPAAARLRRAWSMARGSRSQAITPPRPSATQAWASRPDPQPTSTAAPAGSRSMASRHIAVVA